MSWDISNMSTSQSKVSQASTPSPATEEMVSLSKAQVIKLIEYIPFDGITITLDDFYGTDERFYTAVINALTEELIKHVPPNMSPHDLLKTINELLVPPILEDMSRLEVTSESSETTADLRAAEGLCQ